MQPFPLSRWLFISVLLPLFCAVALNADETNAPLRVLLHADEVAVIGDTVRLGDVAELQGDAALVARVAELPVRRLVDLASYRVEAQDVRSLLRPHVRSAVQIEGSASVRRATEDFSSERLSAVAIAHLEGRAEDRQIQVYVRRAASAQVIAADPSFEHTIIAEPLTDAWWGEVPYRLRIMRGTREVARTLCVLEVHAWREVPVAARPIERGAILSLHDLVLQRVQVAPGSGDTGLTMEDAVGQVALRFIPPGTTIGSGWARPRPAVSQGEVVLLVYEGEGFTLSMHAEALNDGAIGERVRVRIDKGSPVDARVHGRGEVRLQHAQHR